MYVHNYNQGSIYDVNRRQEREIKSLKAELSRVNRNDQASINHAKSMEHNLRKARRTIEMQEAQMQNMQKEISRLHGDQRTYRCEASLVVKQNDEINDLRKEMSKLVAENNSSASRTWVPIERYNKLEEKKNRFKKALAAELDGEDSTRIIDILTEEAPKDVELLSIRHSNPMWW